APLPPPLSEWGSAYGLRKLASSTATTPVRNMSSNVPAPPIEATGTPRPCNLSRLSRSARFSAAHIPYLGVSSRANYIGQGGVGRGGSPQIFAKPCQRRMDRLLWSHGTGRRI